MILTVKRKGRCRKCGKIRTTTVCYNAHGYHVGTYCCGPASIDSGYFHNGDDAAKALRYGEALLRKVAKEAKA